MNYEVSMNGKCWFFFYLFLTQILLKKVLRVWILLLNKEEMKIMLMMMIIELRCDIDLNDMKIVKVYILATWHIFGGVEKICSYEFQLPSRYKFQEMLKMHLTCSWIFDSFVLRLFLVCIHKCMLKDDILQDQIFRINSQQSSHCA